MPTYIDLEPAILNWQARHNQRLTYEELAKQADISIAALYRIKSGNMISPDLRKINRLCKVLECEPGDLIRRRPTAPIDEVAKLEMQRQEIVREVEKKINRRKRRREVNSIS